MSIPDTDIPKAFPVSDPEAASTKYVAPDDPLFDVSDADLREQFLGALIKIHPGLSEADVLGFEVSRVRRVFPIPTLGYSTRLPRMTASVPGLHFVSSAQIVNGVSPWPYIMS